MWNAKLDESHGGLKIAGRKISNLRCADDITLMAEKSSLVAQMVKRLPAMRETWVWSLGWEDLLGKEIATHSSTLAWKIPGGEEHGRLQSIGLQSVEHDWATSLSFFVLMAESKEELKSLLMKVKEDSEKAVLKLNIQKTKIDILSYHFMAEI